MQYSIRMEEDYKFKSLKPYLIFAIIISIGVIVYSNSLGNGLILDDPSHVETNTLIRSLKNITQYFTEHEASSIGGDNYRPLVPLSYAIDYSLYPHKVMGYHITNLIFHIANALLVFFLILLITKERIVAFFTALIFLVHPIQTEAVAWISGRPNVLFLFFLLLSFIFYIRYIKFHKILLYFISLLLFICSILSKEMAAVLPFLLVLYDWLYEKKERITAKITRYLPYILIAGSYILLRLNLTGRFSQTTYLTGGFYTTFLTMIRGIAHYIKLLFCPVNLCADYMKFPISISFKEPGVLISASFLLILIMAALSLKSKIKHISFSMLFFFIALLPVLNIVPIRILIAERFLYLPSVGFALSVAVLFRSMYGISKEEIAKKGVILLQIVLILIYMQLTMIRNKVWHDSGTYNRNILKSYPNNDRAHNNIATYYIRSEKDFDKAYAHLKRCLEISPARYRPRFSLASYYFTRGRLQNAIYELTFAVRLKPDLKYGYRRLAYLYALENRYIDSSRQYEKLSILGRSALEEKADIAEFYTLKNEREKAIEIYRDMLDDKNRIHRQIYDALIRLRLGEAYMRLGNTDLAKREWKSIPKKLKDATGLSTIAALLTDEISLERALLNMDTWLQTDRARAFYYIGLKMELEGNLNASREYYRMCIEEPTVLIGYEKILATQRLKIQ